MSGTDAHDGDGRGGVDGRGGARGGSPGAAGRGGAYPASVERLIERFSRLPGIGRRSAERLAFHVLKSAREEALSLSRAIEEVKDRVRHCSVCFNLADADPCSICDSPSRDRGLVMVVEEPRDLIALEQTGMFRGVYHVLMGRISPLDGIGPEDITLDALLGRVTEPAKNSGGEAVREVVLALNPTLEGDGTALLLAQRLRERDVAVTRLARGLPTGTQLEYANKAVLADAIEGRRPVS